MDDAEILTRLAEMHEKNQQYLSDVFQRARQRYLSDAEFRAVAKATHRAVEDCRIRAEAPMDSEAVAMLTVMIADDLRESFRPEREQFSIGDSSTVYMDGSSLWYVRREGKPGIIYSLRLFPDDVPKIEQLLARAAQ
jgi:hypothetical protein